MQDKMELDGVTYERLLRTNKGFNLFNIENKRKETKGKKYWIKAYLDIHLDLKGQDVDVRVTHNIVDDGYYTSNESLEGFFANLRELCNRPYYKSKVKSLYQFGLNNVFRDKTIRFEDINFEISEKADKYMKNALLFDFRAEFKKILSLQKKLSKDEIKDIEQYIYLKDKINQLQKSINKSNDNRYYNNYEDKDRTIPFTITDEEYNKKLKKIETGIKELAKKRAYLSYNEYDFSYIEKPLSYEEWIKHNKDEIEQRYNEEDTDISFEQYCEECYEWYLDNR